MDSDISPVDQLIEYLRSHIGIKAQLRTVVPWSSEIKNDHDGIKKQFIYLQVFLDYISGEPILPENHEQITFIPISQISNIDIVPPTVEVLRKNGVL